MLYHGRRLVSNNWVAMRALDYSLRARLRGSAKDTREAARLWRRVLAWQTEDGLFIDSPGGDATPVTYHAKFCAMLALALTDTGCGTPEMAEALRCGLDALCYLMSPSGVLVPYGRSRNTLFGYAAAILALRRATRIFQQPRYGAVAALLEGRLTRFQRPDGHIPCVLNDGEAQKRDCDVYVNNPDYNAYAAAMLLLSVGDQRPETGDRPAPTGPKSEIPNPKSEITHLGPLLIISRGGLFAAFVSSGRSVPVGTPFFCDHRYYGMQPLWVERGGMPLLEPAPYAWRGGEDRSALVDPSANSWVPYIAAGGDRYCVRRYDSVEVRERDDKVEVISEGVPEAYDPVPRWERGIHAILGRVTSRPHPGFRVRPLSGVRLCRRLEVATRTGAFQLTTSVEGKLPPGASLHPAAGDWSPEAPL
jgi:hypothetical protein